MDLRSLQDAALNDGWRIQSISYAANGRPMTFGFETAAGYVAMTGVAAFLAGLGYTIYLKETGRVPAAGLVLAAVGFACAAGSIPLRAFLLRRSWKTVHARCIDREVRLVSRLRERPWDARILCEYTEAGATVRCTPFLSQTGFRTESAAWARISEIVASDDACELLVNPKNPLHAEVVARRKY